MGLFIQGATKITQNNGRVDGGAVPDRQLDTNSGNAIANDVVTGALASKANIGALVESTSGSHAISFKWTTTPESYLEIYVDNTKAVQLKGFKKYD